MFKWLKRLFCRPRLIERYEDLDSIIEAHNALIQKTLTVMRDQSVPPKYVLSRFNTIQDAEEKAIAAYWRNKDRKCDKWYRRPKAPESNTMTDIVYKKPKEKPPEEFAATPTIEALPPQTPSDTQALEQPKENVIEIHINK